MVPVTDVKEDDTPITLSCNGGKIRHFLTGIEMNLKLQPTLQVVTKEGSLPHDYITTC